MRGLLRLLYESTPAEFVSAHGLTESVARLRAATQRSAFAMLAETTAVGRVSEGSVSLQRVIPLVRNSFKPLFIGHFEQRQGVTILCGRFTMHSFVKGIRRGCVARDRSLGALVVCAAQAFSAAVGRRRAQPCRYSGEDRHAHCPRIM